MIADEVSVSVQVPGFAERLGSACETLVSCSGVGYAMRPAQVGAEGRPVATAFERSCDGSFD